MGVIVTISVSDDPDGDTSASLSYRISGSGAYRQGFPLTRVSDTRFVGSIFWLEPGTSVDVRVAFTDPDGGTINGTVVEGSGATRVEVTIPAPVHTFIASPSGSGTACTTAVPCALTEALQRAQPGDAVLLRGGVYFQGELSLPRSGNSGAPIVIRGYPGENAILDGSDPQTFAWVSQGGGVYRTTVNAAVTHLVVANGERLYPYQSLSDLQSLRWGMPGFYASHKTLYVYVRLAGDANPNLADMVISRFNHAFAVEQDWIYFDHLTFRYYGCGSWAKAIYFNNASNNLVQHCTFAINDLGIGLKRASGRNLIQNNTFYDTDFNWDWDAVKTGSALETGGVRFYSPTTGRGNVIRRNTFHDYFDGFGACPGSAGDDTNETDVYENLVYNAGDDGMETDGTCSNVRIWSNTFHDVLMGISLAPVYIGPVYVIRNLIYRTGVGNNSYSGSPFKFNSGYDKSGAMFLFHNTSDAVLPGNNGIYIKAPGTWEMITSRNNIWSGTNYALNNYNENQPIDFDYDDLYTTNPDEYIYWGNGADRHMHSLAEFQAKTGQELHGTDAVPGFADASKADYTLDPSSTLVDRGVWIPGINDDFKGNAPDIGAFEYEGFGFALRVAPPVQRINPGEVATYIIHVQSIGTFSGTVALTVTNPSPSLLTSLTPTSLTAHGQATLTVTDTHTAPLSPGLWYTLPIEGKSGESTQTTSARLLIGGVQRFLPVIFKGY